MSGIKELLFSMMEEDHEIAVRRKELFEEQMSDYGLEEAEEEFEKEKVELPVREPSMPEVQDWVKTHDKDAYV